MRKVVGLIAAGFVLAHTAAARAEELTVALVEANGFCWRQADGSLTGFNVETAQLLCARMGVSCRLETANAATILETVAAGRAQIGFGNHLRTPEREARVLFSHPYWRSSSVFIGAAGLGDLPMPEGLAGKRLVVQRGTVQQAWAQNTQAGRATLVERANAAELVAALNAGDADIGLLPMLVALRHLKAEQGRALDFIGLPTAEDGLGGSVHMVVTRARPDLLQALDAALDGAVRDGSLHALSRRFLPFDVY